MASRKWTDIEYDYVKKNYENGNTREIAEFLNRSVCAIHKVAFKFKLVKKNFDKESFYNEELAIKICEDYKKGMSIIGLSEKYKVSQHYTKIWLIKNGLIEVVLRKGKFPLIVNKWNMPNNSNHKGWKGYGEIPKIVFTRILFMAKQRNLDFTITIEYMWDLFLKQDRKCVYTGEELIFYKTTKDKTIQTASLDRIDSSKGYIEGNVQWVHKDVNQIKWTLSDSNFLLICKKITEYAEKTRKQN